MGKHIFMTSKILLQGITEVVGSEDIDQRVFTLPREVSIITGWHIGEVSRSHSSQSPDKIDEGRNLTFMEMGLVAYVLLIAEA